MQGIPPPNIRAAQCDACKARIVPHYLSYAENHLPNAGQLHEVAFPQRYASGSSRRNSFTLEVPRCIRSAEY